MAIPLKRRATNNDHDRRQAFVSVRRPKGVVLVSGHCGPGPLLCSREGAGLGALKRDPFHDRNVSGLVQAVTRLVVLDKKLLEALLENKVPVQPPAKKLSDVS